MKEREGGGANENPGPGTYAAEKVKVVGDMKDMMSNSFSTKVSKLAFIFFDRNSSVHFFISDPSFLPNSTRLQQLQATFLPDKPWSRNSLQITQVHRQPF